MQPSNVLILTLNHQKLAAAFLNDRRYAAVENTSNANNALMLLHEGHFDALMLQDVLQGTDSTAFLKQLQMRLTAPPKVLLLSNFHVECPLVDVSVHADSSTNAILDAAHDMLKFPIPRLCASTFDRRLQIAHKILQEMGAPSDLIGTCYAAYGAALISCHANSRPLRTFIYPCIAKANGGTHQTVERNIRTLTEHTWLHGNLDTIQHYFGATFDAEKGKPTNAELLHTIAAHITMHLTPPIF